MAVEPGDSIPERKHHVMVPSDRYRLMVDALEAADSQMDYYHGFPMRLEVMEPTSWEDVHRKVKQALGRIE